MTTNEQKTQTAKDFIELHKNSNVTEWQPVGTDDEGKYLSIYNNLSNDVYGETRPAESGYLELEISSFDSTSGNPVIFSFEEATP